MDQANNPAIEEYTTPNGVFTGKPDIAYPNVAGFTPKEHVAVGGVILSDSPIEYNANRRTVKLTVRNTGDRPIQVGSHFHFFEVNRYMEFDRPKALGYHLNIPATTAIRFEPGEEKEVDLVRYGGKRRTIGFNDLVNGYTGLEDTPTFYPKSIEAVRRMKEYGFKCASEEEEKSEYTQNQIKK
ncbi:MAG: urease subunit beta [Muribaculaceae bacterium]|uniref:Urease subunit beta n=1 Tax=uncultured bacterium BAC25G1 TaxID=1329523 RepID=R4JGC7_9BACT|nr:urease beta subunit [uncultured bacterium BAC25G1]